MSAPLYRLSRPGDEDQLREIWLCAYGGDAACLDAYFQTCYRPEQGVVAEWDGRLCSAIYWIEGYTLQGCAGPDVSVSYLYALGTLPEFRGKGLGGRTIWHAGSESYRRGADFVCFLPATPKLTAWYEEILGTQTVFFRRVGTVKTGGHIPTGKLERITPERYAELREHMLAGKPHVTHPLNALRYQEKCCQIGHGGFYQISVDGADGVCTLEIVDKKATFGELLAPACDPVACARLVMDRTHCGIAEVRAPAFWHTDFGSVEGDFVQIPGGHRFPKSDTPPYWGPAMD